MKLLGGPAMAVTLLCMIDLHTCDQCPEGSSMAQLVHPCPILKNGYTRYRVNRVVSLNRPLRFYNIAYDEAPRTYCGSVMWFARLPNASEQKALFPTGTMYRDMPVGTKIFLRYFFVDRLDGKSGNPDFNRYMMVFDIPETVPKHSIRVYCMGDDCTLAPLPWNMNIPWPEGKRFNPEDIEHLFPGGTWE